MYIHIHMIYTYYAYIYIVYKGVLGVGIPVPGRNAAGSQDVDIPEIVDVSGNWREYQKS